MDKPMELVDLTVLNHPISDEVKEMMDLKKEDVEMVLRSAEESFSGIREQMLALMERGTPLLVSLYGGLRCFPEVDDENKYPNVTMMLKVYAAVYDSEIARRKAESK